MARATYKDSVFINVPFDKAYKPLFDALVFAVFDCGFVARSALESDNSAQVRISKLFELIEDSKYGIHDISRTSLDKRYHLPRFNMPLELGIFLGATRYGIAPHRAKIALILDHDKYRYQRFCSDIAGQDIREHKKQVRRAIYQVRNWLRGSPDVRGITLPGGRHVYRRYCAFRKHLPKVCAYLNLDYKDLHFNDYTTLVVEWLKAHPK